MNGTILGLILLAVIYAVWIWWHGPNPAPGDPVSRDLAERPAPAAEKLAVRDAQAVGMPSQSEIDELREAVVANGDPATDGSLQLRRRLAFYWSRQAIASDRLEAAELMSRLKWPADALQRTDVPAQELQYAGKNPSEGAPREIVAVFGSGRLRHWLGVRALGFSPDGKLLATPGLDGVVGIWDSTSGEPITRLQSYPTKYEAVAFTPDGKTLVAAAGGGWYHIWDVAGWKFRRSVEPKGVNLALRWDSASIVFHPHADLVIAAGEDNSVLLCDPQTGGLRDKLNGHAAPVKSVTFSGDGATAASGDDAGMVVVWDVATGTLRRRVEPGHGAIRSVALNHDGGLLALGHADGTVAFAHLKSEDPLRIVKVAGVAASLAFSPDGERLLVGGGGTGFGLREIEVESGLLRHTLDSVSQFCHFPRYSPDGSTIACGYWEGEVGLWDAKTGVRRFEPTGLKGMIRWVTASPDGTLLAATGNQNYALIWNIASGKPGMNLPLGFRTATLSFPCDSDRVFAAQCWGANDTRTVGIWNVASGQREQSAQFPADRKGAHVTILAPDASFVANPDDNSTIRISELTGRERQRLHTQAEVQMLAISPDCALIAAAGRDERVRVWNARSGDERWSFSTPGVYGTALAFSPNGRILACGTTDTKIHIWELTDGNEIATLAGHERNRFGIPSLSFNPSGTLLASCSGDGTAVIWDVDTLRLQRTIAAGPVDGLVNAVTFLADGRHLATANFNGTAYLLRLESWEESLARKKRSHGR